MSGSSPNCLWRQDLEGGSGKRLMGISRGRRVKIGMESFVDWQQMTQNSWNAKCKYVTPYFWGQKRLVLAQISLSSPMGLKAIIWLEALPNFISCGIRNFAVLCFCKA
jgi:hypothetical protein